MKKLAKTALVGSLVVAGVSPFALNAMAQGYQNKTTQCDKADKACVSKSKASKKADAKCGEGKCGSTAKASKKADAKCGEGKCGGTAKAPTTKKAEAKCGEGKCGGAK